MTKQKKLRITLRRAWKTFGGKLVVLAVLVGLIALIPPGANGQFGLDPCCAIISAGLKSISSLLQGVVAKPLASIQQIEEQRDNFQQTIVFPAQAIAGARGFAGQVQGQLCLDSCGSYLVRVCWLPAGIGTTRAYGLHLICPLR